MNQPPERCIRVQPEAMQAFIEACLVAAGLCAEHARLMAEMMTRGDLRGVHSHGARLLQRYVGELRGNEVNPRPGLPTVNQRDATAALDGDGGYGYVPTWRATEIVIATARASGVAAASVRNVGHYGAAGHYTLRCAEAGCIGFSVQGRSDNLYDDLPIALWGTRPMSFAIPAGDQHPIVVDGCTNLFRPQHLDLFERVPSAFFMSLGLTAVSKVLADALAGHMPPNPQPPRGPWPKGRCGALVLAVDVEHFLPMDAFAAQVDSLVRDIGQQMQPMPGCDRALLPGALEAERKRAYAREGVPLSLDDKEMLQRIAAGLDVATPW